MKKVFEKIVTIALAFIALLFVIMMLVIMFNPDYAVNMNNTFVHVLLILFACIFGVLTAFNIASAFSDAERVNNILLFKMKGSATKASVSVVKKTARAATKQVEGAKLRRAVLFADENNDIRMKITLKIRHDNVESVVNRVRATVIATFDEVLGFRFKEIDFVVVNLKNNFKPDSAKIDEAVEAFRKEQAALRPAEAPAPVEDAAPADLPENPAEQVSETVSTQDPLLPDATVDAEILTTEPAESAVEADAPALDETPDAAPGEATEPAAAEDIVANEPETAVEEEFVTVTDDEETEE